VALRVLRAIAIRGPVSEHDAFQLRFWMRAEEALLSLSRLPISFCFTNQTLRAQKPEDEQYMGLKLSPETSTWRRTLSANGSLFEIVRLDGTRDSLSDADFERFIASSPIERRDSDSNAGCDLGC